MGEVPPVHWATTSDGVSLGYQVFGSGPVDMVIIPPFAQNIELAWERPEYRRVFERLGRFARVVHFDKRGTGVSDRTVPVPDLDQRVDDTRAVMDAAGVGRCVLYGLSEGGPMAMLFAVTYPHRVDRLVLHATDARIVTLGLTPEQHEQRRWGPDGLLSAWGTDKSALLRWLAPTAWADPDYRAWEPRYERHSATPAAIRDLVALADSIDVRAVLSSIAAPTLLLHVRGDPIIPIERVRTTAAAIPGARLVEHDGVDHFPHIGEVGWWLDEVEQFVTGRLEPHMPPAVVAPQTRIVTFGGFDVVHDGQPIPLTAWGSRRARTLCKRLAAAAGEPVVREQLMDLLWPDEDDPARLPARLSVQLSTVRRLLGGGVIADREAVRLDTQVVELDLVEFHDALRARRDDRAAMLYRGEFLPEDAYADWAAAPRDRARNAMLGVLDRLAEAAPDAGTAIDHLQRALVLDPYGTGAHERLISALHRSGRLGEAHRAHDNYSARMDELGAAARPLATLTT